MLKFQYYSLEMSTGSAFEEKMYPFLFHVTENRMVQSNMNNMNNIKYNCIGINFFAIVSVLFH